MYNRRLLPEIFELETHLYVPSNYIDDNIIDDVMYWYAHARYTYIVITAGSDRILRNNANWFITITHAISRTKEVKMSNRLE